MKESEKTKSAAKQQLQRIRDELRGCPDDKDAKGWRLLGVALIESAASIDHMERIVTALLTEGRKDSDGNVLALCPAPLELRAFAKGVPPVAVIPDGCERCANPSYDPSITDRNDSRSVRWLPHISVTRRGYDCTDRCGCARGDFFRAQDVARRPKEAA